MKKLFTIFAIFFVMIFACGCESQKAGIVFNKYPITENTVMGSSQNFKANTRIYYLVYFPEEIHSRYIFVQIIKRDSSGRLGYKIYYGKTFRLKDEHVNYYDDYIVINETGSYVMQVYSKDNPQKVLAEGYFYVE